MAIEQALTDYYDAYCAFETRCEATLGRDYSSEASCLRAWHEYDFEFLAFYGFSFTDFFALHFLVDDTAMQACITDLASRACELGQPGAPCNTVFPARLSRGAGAGCSLDLAAYAACDLGLDCHSTGPRCGVCTELGDEGASCDSDYACVSGYCFSSGSVGTCRPASERVALGGTCGGGSKCVGNLECVPGDGGRTCEARGLAGDPCGGNSTGYSPDCTADLVCPRAADGGIKSCTPLMADGETCLRNPPVGAAPCQHLCIFAAADAPQGVCGVMAPQVDGDPCVMTRVAACVGAPASLYADIEFVSSGAGIVQAGCTCRATALDCEHCDSNAECRGGQCAGAGLVGGGLCYPEHAAGEPCVVSSQCASGYCDNGTCDSPICD